MQERAVPLGHECNNSKKEECKQYSSQEYISMFECKHYCLKSQKNTIEHLKRKRDRKERNRHKNHDDGEDAKKY